MFFAVRVDRELLALGSEVRRLRKAAELTQEELAHRSGLHVNFLGGIERSERNVGVKALLRLARGLGVHPAELLAGYAVDAAPAPRTKPAEHKRVG